MYFDRIFNWPMAGLTYASYILDSIIPKWFWYKEGAARPAESALVEFLARIGFSAFSADIENGQFYRVVCRITLL
jgi:hypothetical protein